jgi:hypothetical protein
MSYRSDDMAIQPHDPPVVAVSLNHSDIYNSMIYPFTRTVIYGAIWYQGQKKNLDILEKYLPFSSSR